MKIILIISIIFSIAVCYTFLNRNSDFKADQFSDSIYNYSMKRIYLFLLGFIVIVFGEISVKYTSENLQSNLNFILVPLLLFIIINIFFNIRSQKN